VLFIYFIHILIFPIIYDKMYAMKVINILGHSIDLLHIYLTYFVVLDSLIILSLVSSFLKCCMGSYKT